MVSWKSLIWAFAGIAYLHHNEIIHRDIKPDSKSDKQSRHLNWSTDTRNVTQTPSLPTRPRRTSSLSISASPSLPLALPRLRRPKSRSPGVQLTWHLSSFLEVEAIRSKRQKCRQTINKLATLATYGVSVRTCARPLSLTCFTHGSQFCGIGVTLYTLVTGRLPFRSDDPVEMFERIREGK